MLNKSKYSRSVVAVDPFGARFMSRLDSVNGKLTCSLSRAGADDCTVGLGTDCAKDMNHEQRFSGGGNF